ncbi:hypothetical protein ACIP9H_40830 [Streptomyces sp. NPDC088732]|uniref:hypothetical protein n=1 Tax=Streptomyces sp. NPDC088732 TaxID=3365879 RepID=UPI00382D9909
MRRSARPTPGTALAGAVLAIVTALAGPAPSASAHPFGPPSTAGASVQGSRLLIAWNTDKLDWVALGESLGVFGGQGGANSSNLSFTQRLQEAPTIRSYLLKHITVAQAGHPCHGAVVEDMRDFLARGAQVAFDCPAPVTAVDVTITSLTDLHPAYRTMLTATGPAQTQPTLFTSAQPTAHVRFTASGGSVRGTVVAFAIGTVAAALAIGGFVLRRSRRRKAAQVAGPSAVAAHPPTESLLPPGQDSTTHDPAPADAGTGTRSNA